MNLSKIKIGADPEVFIIDPFTDQYISSIGLLGGSKDAPKPLPRDGFFVQEDNVLMEFNIPPCESKADFIEALRYGMMASKDLLPPFYGIRTQASAHFPESELQKPEANIFGCDPDNNAWTEEPNPVPDPPKNGLRTAGGHIHVGYEQPNRLLSVYLVRAMDKFLGLPSIIMDTDTERRRLYGKAGAYREKSYGVEYRTLSSFWLKSDKLMGWAWDQTRRAIDHINTITEPDQDPISQDRDLIVSTINNGDVKAAKELVERYKLALVA